MSASAGEFENSIKLSELIYAEKLYACVFVGVCVFLLVHSCLVLDVQLCGGLNWRCMSVQSSMTFNSVHFEILGS